jgi:Domain of unknown function (DUF1937)
MKIGYYYLATPYTKFPSGQEAAFTEACRIAAKLMDAGHSIYSPIAHTHPIAQFTKTDPLDSAFWIKADGPLMEGAAALIVTMMAGWEESPGIKVEIEHFTKMGKPVLYLDPKYIDRLEISE